MIEVAISALESPNRWTRHAAGAQVIIRNKNRLMRKYPWFEQALEAFLANPDSVHFERLVNNHDIFSARVVHIEQGNDASRLIFHMREVDGRIVLYFLGIAFNHRYNRLLKNIPEMLHCVDFTNAELRARIDDNLPLAAPEKKVGWVYNGSIITYLTKSQEDAITHDTVLVIGSVGSGKSMVCEETINEARQKAEIFTDATILPIIYIATTELASFAAAEDRKLVDEDHPLTVHRFDYQALINYYLGAHEEETADEVIRVLKERIARDKNLFLQLAGRAANERKKQQEIHALAELIYQEMCIIAGFTADEMELYFALGARQSYFPPEQRALIYELFQHYGQHNGQKINYDFYVLSEELIAQKPPVHVIADEIQLLSLRKLRNIIAIAAVEDGNKKLLLVGDNAQNFTRSLPNYGHILNFMQRAGFPLAIVKLEGTIRCPRNIVDFLHHYQQLRNVNCGGVAHIEAEGEIVSAAIENQTDGEVIWWNGKTNAAYKHKIANYLEHSDVMVMARTEHQAEIINILDIANNHKIRVVTPESGVGFECKVLIAYKLTHHEAFYDAVRVEDTPVKQARVKRQDLLKQRNLPFWNLVLSAWGRPTGSLIIIEPYERKLEALHDELQRLITKYQPLEDISSLELQEEDIRNNAEQMLHHGQRAEAELYLRAHNIYDELDEKQDFEVIPQEEIFDITEIIQDPARWDTLGMDRYFRNKKDFIRFWRELLTCEKLWLFGMTLVRGEEFLDYMITKLSDGLRHYKSAGEAIFKIIARVMQEEALSGYSELIFVMLVKTNFGRILLKNLLNLQGEMDIKYNYITDLPWHASQYDGIPVWSRLDSDENGLEILHELLKLKILQAVSPATWLTVPTLTLFIKYLYRKGHETTVINLIHTLIPQMTERDLQGLFISDEITGSLCIFEIIVQNASKELTKYFPQLLMSDNFLQQYRRSPVSRYNIILYLGTHCKFNPRSSIIYSLLNSQHNILHGIDLLSGIFKSRLKGLAYSLWIVTVPDTRRNALEVLLGQIMSDGKRSIANDMQIARNGLACLNRALFLLHDVMEYYYQDNYNEFMEYFYAASCRYNEVARVYPQVYLLKYLGFMIGRDLLLAEFRGKNLLIALLENIPLDIWQELSLLGTENNELLYGSHFSSLLGLYYLREISEEVFLQISLPIIINNLQEMYTSNWAASNIISMVKHEISCKTLLDVMQFRNPGVALPSLIVPLKVEGQGNRTLLDYITITFAETAVTSYQDLLLNFVLYLLSHNAHELVTIIKMMSLDSRKVAQYLPILAQVFKLNHDLLPTLLTELKQMNHEPSDLTREFMILKIILRSNDAGLQLLNLAQQSASQDRKHGL